MTDHRPTHRYTFAGSIDTMGDAKSMNATWSKIETAFDALEKIVKDAGGTLTCTPQRIGTKKIIPAAAPSQNAPDASHLGSGPVTLPGAEAPSDAAKGAEVEPIPHPAAGRGHRAVA